MTFKNPEAETMLLGALATRGRPEDVRRIDRDDFTSEARRLLFDAIARRLLAGEPIDLVLLSGDVRGMGVSGLDVFALFDNPGVSVPLYVPIVRDCRLRRGLQALGTCLATRASDPAHEPDDVLRWVRRQLERVEARAVR